MRLEHFEAHLNELLHDLSSPLNSMRLQLGLLREELKTDSRLARRVENTERQVLRAQRIIDAFVSACVVTAGRCVVSPVLVRVFDRFGIDLDDCSKGAVLGISENSLSSIARSLAEGCVLLMKPKTARARVSVDEGSLFVRVQGEFEQRTVGRALRLSFVNEEGEPALALATTRLAAAAANGTLLLERDTLVLRLPLLQT